MTNEEIARRFERLALLMEIRGDDKFRVRSYRNAAAAKQTRQPDAQRQPSTPPARPSTPTHGSSTASSSSSTASSSTGGGFTPGTHVRHPKYGRGLVLRREGAGDSVKLLVSFPGFGQKKLVEKYAGLEKA